MAQTFNGKKTWGIFNPKAKEPFKISRSKIDLFYECPRCAYIELRFGVKRPSGPAFTLNNAVDQLLKREFDIHRAGNTKHPLHEHYGIDAVPLADSRMDEWRDALRRGISYFHEPTNLVIRGGIDDVWVNSQGEFMIVDYKATSKKEAPTHEDHLYPSYKRQMEIYQWLFRKNGFKVSPVGYFVYVNGKSDAEAFDGKLEFDTALISYKGDDSWVLPKIIEFKETLMSEEVPPAGTSFGGGPCEFCVYREAAGESLREHHEKTKKGSKSGNGKLF